MLVKCNLPVKKKDQIIQSGVPFQCTKKEAEEYRSAGGVVTELTEELKSVPESETQE